MRDTPERYRPRAVTRAAQHIWITVAFVLLWMHFSYVRPYLRHEDWQLYTLYFVTVAGVACRYLTGIRYGHEQWHRALFDGLSILIIALGVNLTGGIYSDLWLVFVIFVIAETLAASARGFLITDAVAIISYVVATWPTSTERGFVTQKYLEMLGTHIFFLVLVASIARTLASEERRRLADLGALREALSVSEERRRLARDLHDGIGHVLTRVILSLEVARRQCRRDPEEAAHSMAQQADALRGAMQEMREIVATLRTDTNAYHLQAAVRTFAEELSATESLEVELDLPEAPLPLSANRQYHLTRVIQEALTNSLRHSQSRQAEVTVRVEALPVGPPRVVAVVRDHGVGFDPHQTWDGRGGHGLQGMSERLSPYGGEVRIDSAPGRGTEVTAELPGDLYEAPLARLSERLETEARAITRQ
jgi:signal transduction histidine kinase